MNPLLLLLFALLWYVGSEFVDWLIWKRKPGANTFPVKILGVVVPVILIAVSLAWCVLDARARKEARIHEQPLPTQMQGVATPTGTVGIGAKSGTAGKPIQPERSHPAYFAMEEGHLYQVLVPTAALWWALIRWIRRRAGCNLALALWLGVVANMMLAGALVIALMDFLTSV